MVQIWIAVAKAVESFMCSQVRSTKKKESTSSLPVRFRFSTWRDVVDTDGLVEHLATYIYNGALATARQTRYRSIATDKAALALMSLQNSVIVLPDGTAILCCPAVPTPGFMDPNVNSFTTFAIRPF